MAVEKRKGKAVVNERPNKKAKSSKSDGEARPTKTSKPDAADSTERKPLAKSVLQQEERAFPRGGGSVLTPIEQKQIQAQAERDVLFEQQTGKPVTHEGVDEDLFDEEAKTAAAKKKQRRSKDGKEETGDSMVKVLKVQRLSYKNLVIGTVVLGHVTAITNKDVELALANDLSGYAPITAVSERLNARISRLLDDEGEEDQEEDDQDVELKHLFYVGQWLRATVTATTSAPTDGSEKSKRHIELSVDPRQTNSGLDSNNIVVNSMVQAAVRSVEDHGIVMDLGLADASIKGFISKKELGATRKLEDIQEGQVMLCLVINKGSNGKVFNLSPSAVPRSAIAEGKQAPAVGQAPTVEGFQPGTAVAVLITDSSPTGVSGKVMGLLDVAADLIHCGAPFAADEVAKRYKIGTKVNGRIIWAIPRDDGSRLIGISLLDHLMMLPPPPSKLPENASAKLKKQVTSLQQLFPTSSIVEDAKVTDVMRDRLFMSLSIPGSNEKAHASVHISHVSDSRTDVLTSATGQHRMDSTHRARILTYNPVDNLYYLSLKPSILAQQFLRIEDLTVGELVKGTVERLIYGQKGLTGILIKVSDSITGLVRDTQVSDVNLEHPERKYREGFPVKARVLSVDFEKRQVRFTLKKTLVNDEASTPIWKDYTSLEPGMESKGTIASIRHDGAVMEFFGNVTAWLPVAEMSETFIQFPEKHFRRGQTVNVRILSVDPLAERMRVSCKDPSAFDAGLQDTWDHVAPGDLVAGVVTEKSLESVTVLLENSLRGTLPVGHLGDVVEINTEEALKKMHIEKKLSNLVVLRKLERSQHVLLTRKPTMLEDCQAGRLVKSFEDIATGAKVNGFVRNVTPEGIYTEFAGGLVGLLPKSQIAADMVGKAAFGLLKDQSLSAWVLSTDAAKQRFILTMHKQAETAVKQVQPLLTTIISNPTDPSTTSLADLTMGRIIKVRVASVKATQINVRIGDKIPGRVDVSEAFDTWEDFKDKKAPLQQFKADDVLDVKILGIHDSRNHRFLPISHRQGSAPVYEFSAKKSRIEKDDESLLRMDSVKVGSQQLAFINNHGDSCVWVNLSPNVRGRIALMDLSDDAGQLQNLNKNFPIGCALRVTVKGVDVANNRLDLTATAASTNEELTLASLSPGMLLTGRVTKVTERAVMVQLSNTIGAPVSLTEISDDYDNLNHSQYNKNDIVRVSVLDVDLPNKRLFISLRPSRVLSSALPVKDPQITNHAQLKAGDIMRGFVKRIAAEKGVFVSLGATVDAFVPISDLSDDYVKDWQGIVEIDQLVTGRIKSVDARSKHVTLSLKQSHIDPNYIPPLTINDLKKGMIVTGKVRKVEDFGAFIDIDGTQPRLSGLCHRSEVAAKKVEDVRALYAAGDVVKAKVLSVNTEARKISLGLKASYFAKLDDDVDVEMDDDDDDDDASGGVEADSEEEEVDMDDGVDLADVEGMEDVDGSPAQESEADSDNDDELSRTGGLQTTGFDWTGDSMEADGNGAASDSESGVVTQPKRKRKPDIKVDMTGDLDKYGELSVSDFERQLLGQPNNSQLWVRYMAFQLQLGEVQRAREIAERALRTMDITFVDEKATIWIARLNLEVEYGEDEQVDEAFKEACRVQDPLKMHEELASIYINSRKLEKADAIFEQMAGQKTFRESPQMWLNYANFLMDSLKAPAKARALLSRALQSVLSHGHRQLTADFAAMEFRSSQGDAERGRTIFEGLMSEFPKWGTGWDRFADLELSLAAHASNDEAKAEAIGKVRSLFDRMASQKMKKRRAKFVFKRWLKFEGEHGTKQNQERVEALAKAYVEKVADGDDGIE